MAGVVVLGVAVAACGGAAGGQLEDMSFAVCDADTHVFHLATADVTGDGRDEVAVACSPATGGWDPGSVEIYAADVDTDAELIWEHRFDMPPRSVAFGDVDGDGATDLVVTVSGPHERTLVVFAGDGSGGFASAAESVTTGELQRTTTFDWTGNGFLDVLLPEGNLVLVNEATAQGFGPFGSDRIAPVEQIHQLGRADIDGDGAPDTVHIDLEDGAVHVYPNGADEPITFPVASDVAAIRDVHAAGDFDGDGTLALVVTTEPAALMADVHLLASDDGETWTLSPPIDGLSGQMPAQILVADFTGDGAPDLMMVPIAAPDTDDYELTLVAGDGAGGFATPEAIAVDGFPYRVVTADTTAQATTELVFIGAADEDNRLVRYVFGRGD